MNKSLLIPLSIIIVGAIIGGVFLFGGSSKDTSLGEGVAQANLRKVDLEINNMFCLGCRSSVTNSLLGIPGVVQADADPRTDSGWVIYDSTKITKEQIIDASIFQAYPARILADQAYGGTASQGQTTEIPPEIEFKLSILAQGLAERGVSLEVFIEEELNDAISQGYWDKVENILDNSFQALREYE